MLVWHVTHRNNLPSITGHGICPSFSQGKRRASWYVKSGQIEWAILHTANRHKCRVSDLVVLRVNVPMWTLKGCHRGGLFYCEETMAPGAIHHPFAAESFVIDEEEGEQ